MMTSRPSLEAAVYQDLRERLVDRSRRNRLLHFPHGARAPIIRVVDEALDIVLEHLRDDGRFRFRPLPDPEGEPQDERTPAFRAALAHARTIDETYRAAIAGLEDDPAATAKEARAERDLRDRVRASMRLPPRPKRATVDLNEYARSQGVDPTLDINAPPGTLPPKHTDDWLQTLLFPDKLKVRLASIHRNVREVEQETGVSTLHIAFGFWNGSKMTTLTKHLFLLCCSCLPALRDVRYAVARKSFVLSH